MSAFGPYPGEQLVDFRELGAVPLFLIHGPTGGGKTTILDAICFALYGECSDDGRNGMRMRSDFADAAVLTEVTYDFTFGSEAYRVQRFPEQERPRLRGEGTTWQPQKATLWRRTECGSDVDEGTVIASRWQRVTEEVERILGLESPQFRQVVVLPQGRFRDFLTAGSKDRQAILDRLFHAEFYGRVEQALKARAQGIEEERFEKTTARSTLLEHAGIADVSALELKKTDVLSRLREASASIGPLGAAQKIARHAYEEGLDRRRRTDEREAAISALSELQLRSDKIAAVRREVELARIALPLGESLGTWRERVDEARAAAGEVEEAAAQAARAASERERASTLLAAEEARETDRTRAREDISRLQELSGRLQALESAQARLEKAIKVQETARDLVSKTARERDEWATTHQAMLQNVERTETLALQRDGLRTKWEQANQRAKGRDRLELMREQLRTAERGHAQARASLATAERTLSAARYEIEQVEKAWRTGQAAALAAQLKLNEPCPVCGSTSHPAPATGGDGVPTDAQVDHIRSLAVEAERRRDAALVEERKLAADVSASASACDEVARNLGDVAAHEPSALHTEAKRLAAAVADAEAAAAALHEAEANLAASSARGDRLEQSRIAALESLHRAESELTEARTSVAEREREVPEELRGHREAERVLNETQHHLAELERALHDARDRVFSATNAAAAAEARLSTVRAAAVAAEKRSASARAALDTRLRPAGFEDDAALEAALRTPEEVDALDAETRRFDAELHTAQERAKRAIAAAAGLEPPDLDALSAAVSEAETQRDNALRTESALVSQRDELERLEANLRSIDAELAVLDERYAIAGALAAAAGGQNSRRITFQRYVLTTVLDEVLEVASLRLRAMSRGRFELRRAREELDQRIAGGLNLEVFDEYTGTARPVASLSGGESFLAALSLSIGLAEVVQAYAGGVELQTVFVDEGFGSLDSEALDEALSALQSLRDNGRLVGVISHVAELRERLAARLEITSTRTGSSARFVIA